MPEIAEVARTVHFLRKHLVGKTIASVKAQDDANVFGKAGTSGQEFQKALSGKKVIDAGQQGKYFWIIMSSPPHPVLHFGMTGWLHIRNEQTYYYKSTKSDEAEEWPPKYSKFTLKTKEAPIVEVAYTDARRFGRIRLVDCPGDNIRGHTPLKENGPDPVVDRNLMTEEWLSKKMKSKHVPVKALLLDQGNISGIGNWVGDEILYHAKLHPEQYSDTFSNAQLKQLHTSILHICQIAVDLLADSSKFPEEWLFKHRWGKGQKDAATKLPSGEKITFITVGGRTSCVVPSVQKKTGPVAGDRESASKRPEKRKGSGGDDEEDQSDKKPKKTQSSAPSENGQTPKKKNEGVGKTKNSQMTAKHAPPKDESNIRRSARVKAQ